MRGSPTSRYLKVVWADVSAGRGEITSLQRKIDRELQSIGFNPEKNFVPHLTVARVKTAKNKEKLASFIREMGDAEFGTSRVQSIELKQSKLTPRGPIYSTLARMELGP